MSQVSQVDEDNSQLSDNIIYDKALQRRRCKVLMLVANAGSTDARVRKEAESLQNSGYEVTVACTQPKGKENEYINGVFYKRSKLVRGVHFGFWVKILKQHLIKVRLVKFGIALFALLSIVIFGLLAYGLFLGLSALFASVPAALSYITSTGLALGATLLVATYVAFKVLTHRFIFGGRYQNYLSRRAKRRRKGKSGTLARRIKARLRIEMRKRVRLFDVAINYGSISFRHLRSINAQKKHYDIVHAHDLNTMIAGVQLSRRMKSKLVFDAHELATHEDDIQHYTVRIFKRILMRAFIDKPDHIITVSQGFRRRFEDFYRKPKVDVIYNTPKISDASSLDRTVRTDAGLSEDDILVVYIGGINRRRGSRQLAQSLAYLPENYNFVMVTGAKDKIKNEILDIFRKHKKPGLGARIQFLPPVPATEVVHYCKTADISVITRIPPKIYFNPQREYSMPNKLFESLFSGLPVVVGSSKEVVEFVQDNTMGLPADCSKPKQLAENIVTVYNDRHNYRKTEDQITELRAKYGWPAQSDKLIEIYDNLLDI